MGSDSIDFSLSTEFGRPENLAGPVGDVRDQLRDPADPTSNREVYINKKKLKMTDLKESDKVTVRVD